MKFRIIAQNFQKVNPAIDRGEYDFFLEEDKWDDYGYHTLYHVHAGRKLTGGNPEYLGGINIMKHGQKENEYYLARKNCGIEISQLPNDFCSMSMSVELYRGLEKYLPKADDRKEFAEALNMIFSETDANYLQFKDEGAFHSSLLRNASMKAYGLALGKEILLRGESSFDLTHEKLTFTLPGESGCVDLDFSSANCELQKSLDLPSRLLACIGDNGAGKSTILYRLARILYAPPIQREVYANTLGTIDPSDVGFRRLFLISYSAFDNFILPGASKEDYKQIIDGIHSKGGRLVYCGIRDVVKEYQKLIEDEDGNSGKENFEESNLLDLLDSDHISRHHLKTLEELAIEFIEAYMSIVRDEEKRGIWNVMMEECGRANPSLKELEIESYAFLLPTPFTVDDFKALSTGIKYLLHSLALILDRIEPNSIIIFDEPENHIQPPLLCKFLYSLRKLSDFYGSLVLVATHSPVILQETLAKNVIVVSRNGETWSFRQPQIETFGENIGNITDEVFNLNTSITNYQNSAERIIENIVPTTEDTQNPLQYISKVQDRIGIELGNEVKAFLLSNVMK